MASLLPWKNGPLVSRGRRSALPSPCAPDLRRVRLQLGCGLTRPEGWINADSSLNSLVQRVPGVATALRKRTTRYSQPAEFIDVRRRWPFDTSSVDIVYASHLYEHLTLKDGEFFLAEARRVLVRGGVIRLVVPDLYSLARKYIAAFEGGAARASEPFLYAVNLHREQTYDGKRNLAARIVNWYQGYPHQHKYMYDTQSLSDALAKASFRDMRSSSYARSDYIEEITDVEATGEGQPSIYVEAKH